mmetsp:Transcript_60930/g.125556  ORF Transcript_60930/g.125556 Transcript_60930/m.125556 type:complete len:531 (+) Transcript_60930:152-1744(+)
MCIVDVVVQHQYALHRRAEPASNGLEGLGGLYPVGDAEEEVLFFGAGGDEVGVAHDGAPLRVHVSVERPQPQPVHVHGVLARDVAKRLAGLRAVAAPLDPDHHARRRHTLPALPAQLVGADAPAHQPVARAPPARQPERAHAKLVARHSAQFVLPPLLAALRDPPDRERRGVGEGGGGGGSALQDIVANCLDRHPVVAVGDVLGADGDGGVAGSEGDGGVAADVAGEHSVAQHLPRRLVPFQPGLDDLHEEALGLAVPAHVRGVLVDSDALDRVVAHGEAHAVWHAGRLLGARAPRDAARRFAALRPRARFNGRTPVVHLVRRPAHGMLGSVAGEADGGTDDDAARDARVLVDEDHDAVARLGVLGDEGVLILRVRCQPHPLERRPLLASLVAGGALEGIARALEPRRVKRRRLARWPRHKHRRRLDVDAPAVLDRGEVTVGVVAHPDGNVVAVGVRLAHPPLQLSPRVVVGERAHHLVAVDALLATRGGSLAAHGAGGCLARLPPHDVQPVAFQAVRHHLDCVLDLQRR